MLRKYISGCAMFMGVLSPYVILSKVMLLENLIANLALIES